MNHFTIQTYYRMMTTPWARATYYMIGIHTTSIIIKQIINC